jgi:hypothetical protein
VEADEMKVLFSLLSRVRSDEADSRKEIRKESKKRVFGELNVMRTRRDAIENRFARLEKAF